MLIFELDQDQNSTPGDEEQDLAILGQTLIYKGWYRRVSQLKHVSNQKILSKTCFPPTPFFGILPFSIYHHFILSPCQKWKLLKKVKIFSIYIYNIYIYMHISICISIMHTFDIGLCIRAYIYIYTYIYLHINYVRI